MLNLLVSTLPGAGRRSKQARSAANGRVGGVAGTATVVPVVKTVVRSRVVARLAVPADVVHIDPIRLHTERGQRIVLGGYILGIGQAAGITR